MNKILFLLLIVCITSYAVKAQDPVNAEVMMKMPMIDKQNETDRMATHQSGLHFSVHA